MMYYYNDIVLKLRVYSIDSNSIFRRTIELHFFSYHLVSKSNNRFWINLWFIPRKNETSEIRSRAIVGHVYRVGERVLNHMVGHVERRRMPGPRQDCSTCIERDDRARPLFFARKIAVVRYDPTTEQQKSVRKKTVIWLLMQSGIVRNEAWLFSKNNHGNEKWKKKLLLEKRWIEFCSVLLIYFGRNSSHRQMNKNSH